MFGLGSEMPDPWNDEDLHHANAAINAGLLPETPEREWEAHAIEFFRIMRRHGLGIEALRVTATGTPAPEETPSSGTTERTISFGKYRGRGYREIAALDPGYIRWLGREYRFRDPEEKEFVENLLRSIDTTINPP